MVNLTEKLNNIGGSEDAENLRDTLIKSIIECQKMMYQAAQGGVSPDWLGIDLTMPQMKIMFLLYSHRKMRMSDMGVALQKNISTATGLVDRLVEHGLVAREEDPDDRRVVVATITERGQELCTSLLQYGEQRFQRVLKRLGDDDLQIVAQAMKLVSQAAVAEAKEQATKQGHYYK